MTLTDEPASPPAGPAPAAGPAAPHLVEGVDLLGDYEGSGYLEPPSLARRADGQVIQLTPLLYAVADEADGTRSPAEIAEAVSSRIGRTVSASNVEVLLDQKLAPLGIATGTDGSARRVQKADPLLALTFRAGVIPERASHRVAGAFRPLFFPPVILAVLAGLVATDVWVFGVHGIGQATRDALYRPATFLGLVGLLVVSAAFHEIGHATACRYGGGEPGRMGCGLYLAWPAFYTDVTDAYRLGRRARLRVDLGGVYFNTVVVIATVGLYLATGWEPFLLLVVLQHVEILHQLLPVVRLDGYYVVADLTGVPDLFARIGPILSSALPWRKADERVTVLKRWVRVAVTLWVCTIVPLLLLQLLVLVLHLPRIFGTAWDSAHQLASGASKAASGGAWLTVASDVLQIVVLTLPVLGIVLMMWKLGTALVRKALSLTAGRPVARTLVALAGAGVVALLVSAWLPGRSYRPIQPGERGTVQEADAAAGRVVRLHAPLAPPPVLARSSRTTGRSSSPSTTAAPSTSTTTGRSTTTVAGRRSGTTVFGATPTSAGATATSVRSSTTVRSTTTTASGGSTATTSGATATTVAP